MPQGGEGPVELGKASLKITCYSLAVGKKTKLPKSKCCSDKPRCKRCPIRMLKDGTLPPGYSVHKRKLVKTGKKLTTAA